MFPTTGKNFNKIKNKTMSLPIYYIAYTGLFELFGRYYFIIDI